MTISIQGMHCQACVNRVRKALERVEGVTVRDVRIGSADVIVTKESEGAALEAIVNAGYQPHIAA